MAHIYWINTLTGNRGILCWNGRVESVIIAQFRRQNPFNYTIERIEIL